MQKWNIGFIIMFSLACNHLKVRTATVSSALNETFMEAAMFVQWPRMDTGFLGDI